MNEEQLKALFASMLGPIAAKLESLGTTVDGLSKASPAPQPAPQPAPAPAPAPQPTPAPAPQPAPAPATQPSTDPAVNAQIAEMRRSMEDDRKKVEALQKAKEEADKRADEAERTSVIDRALGDFSFREGTARQTAITLLTPHIKRNDQGQLIAGDNLPVADFAKDFIPKQHDYLLAPVGGGGAGVTPGNTGFAGRKAVDLNDIKPGMSDETRAAVYAAMQAAASNIGR